MQPAAQERAGRGHRTPSRPCQVPQQHRRNCDYIAFPLYGSLEGVRIGKEGGPASRVWAGCTPRAPWPPPCLRGCSLPQRSGRTICLQNRTSIGTHELASPMRLRQRPWPRAAPAQPPRPAGAATPLLAPHPRNEEPNPEQRLAGTTHRAQASATNQARKPRSLAEPSSTRAARRSSVAASRRPRRPRRAQWRR